MADYKRLHMMAEELCERTVLVSPPPNDSQVYCPPLWDGWGCWNYTEADNFTFIDCPAYIEGFDSKCTRVIQMYITGYSISIISLIIALSIFTYFRQLQCRRVTLHKNMFTCYILNGIVWILYYSLVALDSAVIHANPIWCQILHCLAQYTTTCNFFWMFCEGLYLHTVIVVAFATGKKLHMACYGIGWGFPVIITVAYSITRGLSSEAEGCWLDESIYQYIVFGPIIATLILNCIFMFNIVRVLITKLRAVNSPDTVQTNDFEDLRKAVRAALILIPLLGLQFALYPVTPPPDSPWLFYYNLVTAFVTSFQGLFVAVIFCFLNGEVISVIRRKWGQHKLMRSGSKSRPSCTQATYMETSMQPPIYTNRDTNKPESHMNGRSNGNVGNKKGFFSRVKNIGTNTFSMKKVQHVAPPQPRKNSISGDHDVLLPPTILGNSGGPNELQGNGNNTGPKNTEIQMQDALHFNRTGDGKSGISQI